MGTLRTLATTACTLVLALILFLAAGHEAHAEDGVTKTTVTLGQSVALTGSASLLALPFA